MNWLMHLPTAMFIVFVFAFGLVVGSFLNVLIARLPFEKSVIWPGSRCFTCLQSLRLADNLPIIGYLRLRGKCRHCGATFSSRYLWVELFTGLAFVALFVSEIILNVHESPGMQRAMWGDFPSLSAWVVFFSHAFLLAMLIAASAIDLQYKVVPPHITVTGTLVGIVVSTLFPWPFPNEVSDLPAFLRQFSWNHPATNRLIPIGLAMWPAWEPSSWMQPGSHLMGLLTGLAGAAAGQALGRAVKYLFEMGFGKEALGIGDADLMMMAGAFLGWQPIVLAFFVGAVVLLPIVLFQRLIYFIFKIKTDEDPAIPFGPGIAMGIVICWFAWKHFFGELVQTVFFDETIFGFMVVLMGGGLLLGGTVIALIRAKEEEEKTI